MADVGIKFDAEGYSDFKKNLKDFQDQMRVMGSSLKEVKSQFDKNDTSVSALTKKNAALEKSIKTQKSQVDLLANGVKAATAEFGENDKRTQDLIIKYNNAKTTLNNLTKEYDQNEKAIDEVGDKTLAAGEKADKAGGKFEGFGKVMSGVAKAAAVAVAAAAAAVVAIGKEAIESYSEYEQLVGGVDTLFGESSQTVQEYAANAYKTAGMSANDYMSTVTSFSASLLQSLGGDTSAAAAAADMAITDMADNANKMGTDMESVQSAYQGFAKQQYTLLDNLKLGYGGTKTEMERLLSDAEKLSGQEYDISNLNDVYEAIHVVQTEMGITGTTAREASSTIQGSVSAMKSAWQNLVTGMADGDADMSMLIDNFVDSVGTAGENILPKISQILAGIGEMIAQLAPKFAQMLPGIISDTFPALISASTQIINSLATGIMQSLPVIIPAVVELVTGIAQFIVENLPLLIQTALDMVITIANGLVEALPELIPAIVDMVLQIVDTLTNPDSIGALIDAALAIMIALTTGLIDSIPKLVEKIPEIIINIVTAIVENLPKILEAGVKILMMLIEGIVSVLSDLVSKGKEIVEKIGDGISDAFDSIVQWGKDIIGKLWEGIKSAWEDVKAWFSSVWDGLFGNNSVNVSANVSGGAVNGSHANGLNYVPFDGYVAELHRGEMVVPAALAESLRNINTGTSNTQSVVNGIVNGISGVMGGSAASGDLYIEIPVDGQKFYRATIKDFRRVNKAMPEVFA